MAKQCSLCFQLKDPLVPALEKAPVRVCKACAYKISAVTGFLTYHGVTLAYQPELTKVTPPTPPDPSDNSRGKKKGPKKTQDTPTTP